VLDTLVWLALATVASILVGIVIIACTGPLKFNMHPWRLLTPKKVREYRRLRVERVKAGRFFDITCEQGHVSEMTGVELCRLLDSLGEYVLCAPCADWVKVIAVIEGRSMTEEQKEQQAKDYAAWIDEMQRFPYSEVH
jgi:hypothetical protein